VVNQLSFAVEISNIPTELNTEDIDDWLERYQDEGYKLSWVNETYCVAIFRSIGTAKDALRVMTHPDFVLREFSQASEETKRWMLKRGK
jgi:hypothetical protein